MIVQTISIEVIVLSRCFVTPSKEQVELVLESLAGEGEFRFMVPASFPWWATLLIFPGGQVQPSAF